jgi:beta-lactamase class A
MLAIAMLPVAVRLISRPIHFSLRPTVAAVQAAPAVSPVVQQAKATAAAQAATAAALASQTAQLQGFLNSFTATLPANAGIVIKDLKTGAVVTSNPDQQLVSASLYKLFVATEVYRQIDLGKINYADAAGSGTGMNIADCLRVMINISDNACGNALGAKVGWSTATNTAKTDGFTNTDLTTDLMHTSAGDVSKLFERLYNGTLLSPDSSSQFLALLKDQRVNNRLPVGLPAGTAIAHKTGDLFGYVHDAGIVYGPKSTYLVTMMGAPGTTPDVFAKLSRQVYGLMNP